MLEAHSVADIFADARAKLLSHSTCGRNCCDTTWLCHHDAAIASAAQELRQLRSLSRPGLADDDHAVGRLECREQRGRMGDDWVLHTVHCTRRGGERRAGVSNNNNTCIAVKCIFLPAAAKK